MSEEFNDTFSYRFILTLFYLSLGLIEVFGILGSERLKKQTLKGRPTVHCISQPVTDKLGVASEQDTVEYIACLHSNRNQCKIYNIKYKPRGGGSVRWGSVYFADQIFFSQR